MIKRPFGRTGLEVFPVGFGAMRLPLKGGGRGFTGIPGGEADLIQSVDLIRYAIEQGINYVDTGYNYLDGDSEIILGQALRDGYREKVLVATKAPVWLFKQPDDFDRYLDEQLTRLHTDHIDIYLLHGLSKVIWEKKVLRHRVPEKLQWAKENGIIQFTGFSFHDDIDTFERIVTYGFPWDMCQIQLNYYDTEYQAGLRGLKLAAEKGMAVSIMEPLRGGYLTRLPRSAAAVFKTDDPERTLAEWAFDYLWDLPQVSVVLSGMGSKEEVDENIKSAMRSSPNMLSEDKRKLYEKVCGELAKKKTIPCTGCCYCMNACPQHLAIPHNFFAYNDYLTTGDIGQAQLYYRRQMNSFGRRASACVGCRSCEERCPQHISISEWMPVISSKLE